MTKQAGQTLIEVLVALSVSGVVLTAISSAVLSALSNSLTSKSQNQATQYAQQGIDQVRQLRDSDFSGFTNLSPLPDRTFSYCMGQGTAAKDIINYLTAPGGANCTVNINNSFKRWIDVAANDPISCSNTTKITVNVTWSDNKCPAGGGTFCHSLKLTSCLGTASRIAIPGDSKNLIANWKFDEGTGTVANDSSGNGLTGTLVGSPTWTTTAVSGNALSNGISGYVSVADSALINFVSKPFTIVVWAYKTGSYGGSFVRLVDKAQAGQPNGYGFDISNTQLRMLGATNLPINYTMPTGLWVHLAATYDGVSTGTVYVNGTVQGTGTYTSTNAWTGPLRIGADSNAGSVYVGYLDEVTIYNYVRSQSEVLADMNAFSVPPTPTPTLIPTPTPTPIATPTPIPSFVSFVPNPVSGGGSGTVDWSYSGSSLGDYIALYTQGAPGDGWISQLEASCSSNVLNGRGPCTYVIPAYLPAGPYEVRYIHSGNYTTPALTSPPFTINN